MVSYCITWLKRLMYFTLISTLTNYTASTNQRNLSTTSTGAVNTTPVVIISNQMDEDRKQTIIPSLFHTVNVELEKTLSDFSTFSLDRPVWFEIMLPSLQVELVLMFNSSAQEDSPIFDVNGTFCKVNESRSLFVGLKGPISKMIARKDLLSLKAMTDCDVKPAEVEPRVYLNAVPRVKLDKSVGTLYAFLLRNQTAMSKRIVATDLKSATSYPVSSQTLTTNVMVVPTQQVVLGRAKRQAISFASTTLASVNSIHRTYNFSGEPEQLRFTLIEDDKIRRDCNTTVELKSPECRQFYQVKLDETLVVDLVELFRVCGKLDSVDVSATPTCSFPSNGTLDLSIASMPKPAGRWYQNSIFIKCVLIGTCVLCVVWVGLCYFVLRRKRWAQIERHNFQRNTVLQLTTSDPTPRRTPSGTEFGVQTKSD